MYILVSMSSTYTLFSAPIPKSYGGSVGKSIRLVFERLGFESKLRRSQVFFLPSCKCCKYMYNSLIHIYTLFLSLSLDHTLTHRYFIFTSFWQYKIYYVFGFMLLVYVIMIVVTVCVTIVCTYFLLNSEDYRWCVCVCVHVYMFVRMRVIVYLQMCSECMRLVTVYVSLATGSGPVSVLVAPFPSTFTSIQYTTSSSKPSEHSLDICAV